jgi:hypothetical protein
MGVSWELGVGSWELGVNSEKSHTPQSVKRGRSQPIATQLFNRLIFAINIEIYFLKWTQFSNMVYRILYMNFFSLVVAASLLLMAGCNKEEEFMFKIEDLVGTQWGIPQVVEPGMEYIEVVAPTVFEANGVVSFGNSRFDFWYFRDKRTIVIEQAREIWFIIDLRPDRLYVEITRHPEGTFLGKFIYEPL